MAIELEVCLDSLQSALNAIHGGADELEVCSSLAEGGLTPTVGLVKEIQSVLNNLAIGKLLHSSCPEQCYCLHNIKKAPKLNVMLRCRTGSDFCYTQTEMDTMFTDLDVFKALSVDRFVFGALNAKQQIDKELCTKILKRASPIPVTFHRAFDICADPFQSLEDIITLGFNRLLTSGQETSASDSKAIDLIRDLVEKSHGRIVIMPGAGVNSANVTLFMDIGCKIVHSSCKMNVQLPKVNSGLSMGHSDSELFITDERHVRLIKSKSNS